MNGKRQTCKHVVKEQSNIPVLLKVFSNVLWTVIISILTK